MSKSILFLANRLAQGTGPFQRYEVLCSTFRSDKYFWMNLDQELSVAQEQARRLQSENLSSIKSIKGSGFIKQVILTKKLCGSENIDVIFAIHTRAIFVALFVSMLSRRRLKVVAFEGTLFSRYRFWQMYFRKIQNLMCDFTICVAEHVKLSNSLFNLGSVKRIVIYNGISKFSHNNLLRGAIPDSEFNILFIGDLKPYKRPIDFIKIISMLNSENKTINAHIFGDGELLCDVKGEITKLSKSIKFTLHGHVDRNSIRKFLSHRMGCGVICSELEGLSEVAVQFAYHGWPVVCTNIPGNQEFFKEVGYYFGISEVNKAAYLIQRIMDCPDITREHVNICQDKAFSTYSIESIARAYDRVFEKCLRRV